MAGSKGPWGGGQEPGEGDKPTGERPNPRPESPWGGRRPGEPGQSGIPEIDQIVRKGQEQLRVLMGGRSRQGGGGGGGSGGGDDNPLAPFFSRQGLALAFLAALGLWSYASFYTVRPEQKSVELFLGKYTGTPGEPGLNFAPWPFVRAEIVEVTGERQTDIGSGTTAASGLMLTRDQNIVDIEFQVVWNVSDPAQFLFNLKDPEETISAVAESAMRDIIARSELSPILNRERGAIAADLQSAVQATLDSYEAGINVVRVNFDKADPPSQVINAFRDVQAAQQERDRLEKEADAYANRVTAGARGEAARLVEEAEAYRARVVNDAEGEASRFLAVYAEYLKAPEVTRRRMYLETMENVLGGMNKVILDGVTAPGGENAGGVLPVLPLNGLALPPGAAAAGGN